MLILELFKLYESVISHKLNDVKYPLSLFVALSILYIDLSRLPSQ